MHPFISDRLSEIERLCRLYHVRRLELFGSAAGDQFNVDSSDVDLIIEFEPLSGAAYTSNYWGLHKELETLFGRPVDIFPPGEIRNPYLRESVDRSRQLLYTA
jgi:uncharacterized protein